MVMVPDTIAYDGSEDVAVELSAWLASNKSNTTVTFQPNGIYRINDGNVEVRGASNLIIDGNGATLRRTIVPLARYPLYHSSSIYIKSYARDVTIRNFTIEGVNNAATGWLGTWADAMNGATARFYQSNGTTLNNADPPGTTPLSDWGCYCVSMAFDHAIEVEKATRVIVEDCTVSGVFGDGVYFHDGIDGMIVRRCEIDIVGRQGFAWNTGRNILIDSNNVYHARHAGMDLECDDASQTVSNVEVRNNYFNSWLTSFASIGPGVVNDIWYHGNVTQRQVIVAGTNSASLKRYRWRFEDNVFNAGQAHITGANDAYVRLEFYDDCAVRRNTIYGNPGTPVSNYGVYIKYAASNWWVESNWMRYIPGTVRVAGGSDANSYVEDNNTVSNQPAPGVPIPTILDATGTLNEIRNVGGNLFKWDGSAWKFNGKEFPYFTPLVDWSA